VAMAGLKMASSPNGEGLIYKLRAQCLLRGSQRIDTDVVRLRVVGYRKTNGHACPFTPAAFGFDAAVVGLGYDLGDGQTQTRTLLLRRSLAAVEALEDLRKFVGWYAGASVGDLDQ
jgi:hypothetical protein